MSKPKFAEDFSAIIKELAKACSDINVATNRIWLFCFATTLVVMSNLGADPSKEVELLGAALRRDVFFPLAAIVLLAANIAYCTNHIQGYRIARTYREIIDATYSDEETLRLSNNTSMKQAAFYLVKANNNRIHPTFSHVSPSGNELWYRAIKMTVDVVYSIIPWFGILGSMLFTPWINFGGILLCVAGLLTPLSAFCTYALLRHVKLWTKQTSPEKEH